MYFNPKHIKGEFYIPIRNFKQPTIAPIFRVQKIEYTPTENNDIWLNQIRLYYFDLPLDLNITTRGKIDYIQQYDLVSSENIFINPINGAWDVNGTLIVVKEPDANINLFKTVPMEWVKFNHSLIGKCINYWEMMSEEFRLIFNSLFWRKEDFKGFCDAPSSMKGHDNGHSGNLKHTSLVIDTMLNISSMLGRDKINLSLMILAGLLHDGAKYREYYYNHDIQYGMTSISFEGNLVGHKLNMVRMLAAVESRLGDRIDNNTWCAIYHCITAHHGGGHWLGINKPLMLEASLLQAVDKFSGNQYLIIENIDWTIGGVGNYHRHLKGRPFYLEEKRNPMV